ncbi:hypothetical protein R3P38DRAFT_3205506 [Favolaschia claudopus]|uniref:Uncharacterized protein n=1 Tax=Favolaschia claudopus TaxID=2862362 RepID=A0AAW0ANR7_9AGAR
MSGLPASLRIPDGPEKLSLPHKNLPVSELIAFTLPPQRKSTVYPDPADYLSELPPTVETFKITEMVVPPSIVVKNLGRAILMDSDRYPLWLATVWSILERVREAKALWCAAVDPLHERLEKSTTSEAAAENIKASLAALKMLPWDGEVKGFRAGGSVENLTHWFTKDWLNTDHEDHLLELLAAELGISDGSTSCIQTTYFVLALAQAYENPTEYRNSR